MPTTVPETFKVSSNSRNSSFKIDLPKDLEIKKDDEFNCIIEEKNGELKIIYILKEKRQK
jgi:hypothetical protein